MIDFNGTIHYETNTIVSVGCLYPDQIDVIFLADLILLEHIY